MTPEEKLITVCKNIIKYSINPEFQNQISEREQRCVSAKSDKELFEIYVNIIAYSQNATSSAVETVINSGVLKTIFKDFDQNEVSKMNPCDIADEHWELKWSTKIGHSFRVLPEQPFRFIRCQTAVVLMGT